MRVLAKRGEEGVQIIADEQSHLRIGQHTPHGAGQILVADFRRPAPPGVVNRQRQAGLKHAARLFGKAATGKIDMPDFRIRQAAAGPEQRLHRGVDDRGVDGLQGLDELRTKARQGPDRHGVDSKGVIVSRVDMLNSSLRSPTKPNHLLFE
jgi:hypothetical protein